MIHSPILGYEVWGMRFKEFGILRAKRIPNVCTNAAPIP